MIPVSPADVAAIPEIALSIPDFEGQAILRIFSNLTESEIGCYTAVVTNGASFSHPAAVGTVLGVFTIIALLASFATAIYGEAVPTMRLHHAHSLSVGVVFAVWQHIYFTGVLSMNWPSVLPAFWSNFAWAGGMIYSQSMQDDINSFIGNDVGNTSSVGAAASGTAQTDLGGGYDITQLYRRGVVGGAKAMLNHPLVRDLAADIYGLAHPPVERSIERRNVPDESQGYRWYGRPVQEGLPLPGNYSGFAGTLAPQGIRASNAFMTSFLWLIIIMVILVAATMAFKWFLEGLSAIKILGKERLAYFRSHWLGYSALVALRTCFIAFFAMILLTTFQFTYAASAGVTAVAAIVFIIFLLGIPGAAVYACFYKIRIGNHESNPERFQTERKKLLGRIPWFGTKRVDPETHNEQGQQEQEPEEKSSSVPFWKRAASTQPSIDGREATSIHDDEQYTKKFGWLAARFRRTKWWFFAFWIMYEFIRAVFYGGASGRPFAQVFGLLVVEVLAFAFMIWARPFESTRLNILVVYCLGFSKVACVGLSAAFDVGFNLERITTTVIGIVIIVIQGILTIITLIAIIISAISSAMSVSRNRETFRPKAWTGMREKYFDHLDRVVNDLPRAPKQKEVKPEPIPVVEQEEKTGFEVKGVRREPRIEDEDTDFNTEMASTANPSRLSLGSEAGAAPLANRRRSRAASTHSVSNLPYGARSHRPSWSSRDFAPSLYDCDNTDADGFAPVDMSQQVRDDNNDYGEGTTTPRRAHSRMRSRSNTQNSQTLQPQISSESVGVGADVSSRDSIGKVPQPGMRPRAGTGPRSRGNSVNMDDLSAPDAAWLGASQRGGRAPPLTPALEVDEWGATGPHR